MSFFISEADNKYVYLMRKNGIIPCKVLSTENQMLVLLMVELELHSTENKFVSFLMRKIFTKGY